MVEYRAIVLSATTIFTWKSIADAERRTLWRILSVEPSFRNSDLYIQANVPNILLRLQNMQLRFTRRATNNDNSSRSTLLTTDARRRKPRRKIPHYPTALLALLIDLPENLAVIVEDTPLLQRNPNFSPSLHPTPSTPVYIFVNIPPCK